MPDAVNTPPAQASQTVPTKQTPPAQPATPAAQPPVPQANPTPPSPVSAAPSKPTDVVKPAVPPAVGPTEVVSPKAPAGTRVPVNDQVEADKALLAEFAAKGHVVTTIKNTDLGQMYPLLVQCSCGWQGRCNSDQQALGLKMQHFHAQAKGVF